MAMQALTQAIYNAMAGDTTLTGMLSTYSGGPAIFMYAPVPGAATRPFVVCANSIVDRPFDTKNSTGREETRIIGCYDVSTVSYDIVEAIAERVRFLFHHIMLPVTGYTMILAEASGPIVAPADDQMTDYVRMVTPSTPVLAPFGLLVTVRWIIN
jgi:hypothetical protein